MIYQRSRNSTALLLFLLCYVLPNRICRLVGCCQQRGALTDAEGSSDFFRDDDSSQIVNTADDTSSFHIYLSPYFTNYAVSICKQSGIILADLHFDGAMI